MMELFVGAVEFFLHGWQLSVDVNIQMLMQNSECQISM
jgi:hypothetical protein